MCVYISARGRRTLGVIRRLIRRPSILRSEFLYLFFVLGGVLMQVFVVIWRRTRVSFDVDVWYSERSADLGVLQIRILPSGRILSRRILWYVQPTLRYVSYNLTQFFAVRRV